MLFSFLNNSVRFFICGMTKGIQRALRGPHAPEVKAEKSETLTSRQIDDPTLLLVQFLCVLKFRYSSNSLDFLGLPFLPHAP